MPRRGSHAHDVEQSRVRSRLEDRGIPDERAEDAARDAVGDDAGAGPTDERGRGPLGERGGGGGPGNVIDLRSPAFNDHTVIPPRYTAADANLWPPLEWSPPPPGTIELAVVCEDVDAPDEPELRWIVTGIDPAATSVEEGAPPDGATVWPNALGHRSYDGPNPPVGDEAHRYRVRLVALDDRIPTAADAAEVLDELDDRRISSGTLVGLFVR